MAVFSGKITNDVNFIRIGQDLKNGVYPLQVVSCNIQLAAEPIANRQAEGGIADFGTDDIRQGAGIRNSGEWKQSEEIPITFIS
jgi:hypothetical protein